MRDFQKGWTIIAASGPSLTKKDLLRARNKAHLVVVNDVYKIAPWADVLYACDGEWWEHHKGCPSFKGQKWTQDKKSADRYGLRHIKSVEANGLSFDPGFIHQGGNSGYQAINLAVLMGARKIALLGYNMQPVKSKRHFFGDHPGRLNKSSPYARWVKLYETMHPELNGIEIVNCTENSALTCFKQGKLEDIL